MNVTKTIRVGVYGGMVQWVEGVPEGVVVQVFDYDTDGVNEKRLKADECGKPCMIAVYDCQQ